MTDQDPIVSEQTYRIGSVSRLTGIPADTLRVWERRYNAVTPIRSEAGTRLYASEDVGRLILIKRLVDRGDAISRVANLTLDGLRERMRGADLQEPVSATARRCRVVAQGSYLAERLRQEGRVPDGVELAGLFATREALLAATFETPPDVLVLELPTIHGDQIRDISQTFAHTRAARAILVYGFASRSIIGLLNSARVTTRRAPLETDELYRCCLSLDAGARGSVATEPFPIQAFGAPLPARRFQDAELARIAAASAGDECECARHLVDLVVALTAFETYASACAIRMSDDMALHADLHASAASARSLLESALERAIAATAPDLGGED